MYPQATLKLARSASDQNKFLTYVCLINDIKPNDNLATTSHKKLTNVLEVGTDDHIIVVERSKALHELVESHRKSNECVSFNTDATVSTAPNPTTSNEETDISKSVNEEAYCVQSPSLLKLTKMKWLTEDRDGAPDSSSPSISPTSSTTSSEWNRESESNLLKNMSLSDKYLSTILRLDKEHNLFGLSSIAIVGPRTSKKIRKEDDKAVFHQTAIVQICCQRNCCRHKSNTDLPSSLKCGGCSSCCIDPCCPVCLPACGPPCNDPCPLKCKMCPPTPSKCLFDCSTCFGLKITVNKKPKYDPAPLEVTPRSSCILQKPLVARSCHHLPRCVEPSGCFPYLMPCFWPARPSAPCSVPTRCFHNPPCRAARTRKSPPLPPEEACAPIGTCKDVKCKNETCPGNNPSMKKVLEERFGNKPAEHKKPAEGKQHAVKK